MQGVVLMRITAVKENSKLTVTVSGRIDTATVPELKEDEGKNGGIPIEEAL